MLFHDYEPYAMNESGGTYMRAEPSLAKDLVWAGIDMVARANKSDIDAAWQAVQPALHPRIHTFLATSGIHLQWKLKITPEEALRQATNPDDFALRIRGISSTSDLSWEDFEKAPAQPPKP